MPSLTISLSLPQPIPRRSRPHLMSQPWEDEVDPSAFQVCWGDGEPIAAEQEASSLMAVRCEEMVKQGLATQEEVVPSEFEVQRSADLWAADSDLFQQFCDEADEPVNGKEVVQEEEEGGNQSHTKEVGTMEADEAEGMGEPSMSELMAEGMSREGTAEEEQWILEKILKKRRIRQEVLSAEDRYDDDGKATEGVNAYEYLCKWKWYDEPTWETGTLLEEEGFGAAVKAFLEGQQAASAKDARPFRFGGPKRTAHEGYCRRMFTPYTVVETQSADSPKLFRNLFQEVIRLFERHGNQATAFVDVAQRRRVATFLSAWRQSKSCPVLVFHGTRAGNIASIIDRGFLIPGKAGVRVEHGSAFGVGIYSATDPETSMGYTDDRHLMFACVGLVGGSTKTTSVGNYRIFSDSRYILPLWVLRYKRIRTDYQPLTDGDRDEHGSQPQWWSLSQLAQFIKGAPDPTPTPHDIRTLEGKSNDILKRLANVKATGGDQQERESTSKVVLPSYVPSQIQRKGASKKLIKKMPRFLKDYYKDGALRNLKSG
jgi:hypothetical protein